MIIIAEGGQPMTEQAGAAKRIAQCACGSLRAEVTGEPLHVTMCFCEQCQRRTGSVFGLSTYWMRQNATVSGPFTLYTRKGQSGNNVTFYFCPTCGSTVCWDLGKRPDELGIAGGAFFDPNFPAPTTSVWEQSRHDWVHIPAPASNRFQQSPPPPPPSG